MKTKSSVVGRLVGYGLLIACVATAGWLLLYRQYVVDQVTVWQYKPDDAVQSVEKRAYFSPKGDFLFRASQPTVDGTQTFNQYCKSSEPQSAILGCYVNQHIYIYHVKDTKLDGIEEVTAAHEMLHAAWDRLGKSEKSRLSKLLEDEYRKLNDASLNQRMAYYAKAEPTERDNELHSIFGTEFSNLSPELTTYYSQYFTNRPKLVVLHQKYEAVFDDVKRQGDTLAAQLTTLADQINSDTKAYNTQVSKLHNDITAFNQRAQNGGFTSKAEFDNERALLVERSASLESIRQVINSKIATYNTVRDKLEAINSQADALNKSIDSSLAPAPSV